ncbi:Si-specific NAD(P)(+) transhydrogenase [Fuerstiella marisgermanici]|uniref:Soluble pyridine nucleotide transhydrogenase n=1 Tax=Fuerstiella marisgermanici TaxID=1891926 RepID=A0A1P8WN32_9PLAN|nr:Si-specific NAD(P)(+) transhydrogenase [Fuerstiella marisgermanici]APZ95473.1 Soluble pyridine nucleotide transhydrogenase [Fuerstiella marisgermanici]
MTTSTLTPDSTYDVIVIGTGPGGEGAAMEATKQGKSVAVVEKQPRIGGNCTHLGTIPSKSLRAAIYRMMEVNNSTHFQQLGVHLDVGFRDLRRSAQAVIEKQVAMRRGFYDRNDVTVYNGTASFLDANRVQVDEPDGDTRILSASSFVIATGSRPYNPPDVDFNHPRVFDSDTVLDMSETPRAMTIYGAGVIGCEYASMFRNLSVKLNLVNTRSNLLDFLDDEICDALSYHMRDTGVRIRNNETFDHVETFDDHVVVHLKSGKQLKSDVLLWANGRSGNTENLGLDTIDITPNHRGQIEVNENFQTIHEHIYAVGDVIGPPALASAAYVQGRVAARHLGNGHCEAFEMQHVPTGIYTSPEISSLGKTEKQLTEECVPYEVGHSMFKSLARAQIMGHPVGMLKLLFHRETLEILGIHCFGVNASEIIHIGQAIMAQPGEANTLLYFMNTTFNYPTMAEAYRVAALNGYNRLL